MGAASGALSCAVVEGTGPVGPRETSVAWRQAACPNLRGARTASGSRSFGRAATTRSRSAPVNQSTRPAKILFAHQWKAERGLYGADRVLLRILRALSPDAELTVVVESEGEFTTAARDIGCRALVRPIGVLRRRRMTFRRFPKLLTELVAASTWMTR